MNILERRVENQVQFWSLLGPFVILASIAVLLFKVSDHWMFPISALIGVPLCVKWKLKGMAAALCCLFAFSTTTYFGLEVTERYWHVGMGLAIAFAFIVLTLSLEEVEGLIGQLQMESQSRLENFTRLDEKWKGLEQQWINEREKLQAETTTLTRDLTRIQEDKQTFYKLAQLAKDELIQVRTQYEQAMQELLYKKQQIAQFHERLEENEATIQGFVNSDAEQQIEHLSNQLTLSERDRETCKVQTQALQNQIQAHQAEKEEWLKEKEALQEKEKISTVNYSRERQEKIEKNQQIEKLQETIYRLEQDNLSLIGLQTDLKKQHDQICQLEEQHRQTIQSYQNSIHEGERKLNIQEQHNQTYQKHQFTLESSIQQYMQMIKDKEENIARLNQTIEQTNQTLCEKQIHFNSIQEQCEQLQQALHAERLNQIAIQKDQQHQTQILADKEEKIASLTQDLDQMKQVLFEKQEHFKAVQEQLDQLKQMYVNEQINKTSSQQNIEQLKQVIEESNQRLANEQIQVQQAQQQANDLNQAMVELQQSLIGEQFRARIAHKQVQELEKSKQITEQRLVDVISQLKQAQIALEESKKHTQDIQPEKDNLSAKRHEALYLQLRDQFQEKSNILEATRRELFHTQEKLSALQKTQEEEQLFEISIEEQRLQRLLHQLSKQYDKMEIIYQKEINELYDLINCIFKN